MSVGVCLRACVWTTVLADQSLPRDCVLQAIGNRQRLELEVVWAGNQEAPRRRGWLPVVGEG